MGAPVSDHEAIQMLELWGLSHRAGCPRGYPKIAPFVPQARGRDLEWSNHKVELVGWVVQQLSNDERLIVKMYFEPQSSGRRLKVNKISEIINTHHKIIHRALDRCIGRVAAALSMPQIFKVTNIS